MVLTHRRKRAMSLTKDVELVGKAGVRPRAKVCRGIYACASGCHDPEGARMSPGLCNRCMPLFIRVT